MRMPRVPAGCRLEFVPGYPDADPLGSAIRTVVIEPLGRGPSGRVRSLDEGSAAARNYELEFRFMAAN